jgi:O-acetyl-ADP-ribose deacetylase (regulator of RNase III)
MHNLAERLVAVYGDICELDVDAIVNPAHADLLGGGGLDGTIHNSPDQRSCEPATA